MVLLSLALVIMNIEPIVIYEKIDKRLMKIAIVIIIITISIFNLDFDSIENYIKLSE